MTTLEINSSTILYKPKLNSLEREGIFLCIDSEAPNWIATDERGAKILNWVNDQKNFGEILRLYGGFYDLDEGKSWRDVYSFVHEALRRHIISPEPIRRDVYQGRAHYLKPTQLKEFWIHLTQTCNLNCTHCLVSSSPKGERGQDTNFYLSIIDQAYDLGVRRFYVTGGEPFVRDDIFELIRYIADDKNSELIILTNATLFEGKRAEALKSLNRQKLKFQVSLDGATAPVNDVIRGQGVFYKASKGLKLLNSLEFETSLTAAVTHSNINDLKKLPGLAAHLGAKSVHLMWLHKRGRILETDEGNTFPSNVELLSLARHIKHSCDSLNIVFDNYESIKQRVNGHPFVKYDLGNLCWESLCLYIDGFLYPSAAMAGEPRLRLGDACKQSLRSLWLDNPMAQTFRATTVAEKESLKEHPFRFLTGGGDLEHGYFFGDDPYHELYVEIMKDAMTDLALQKKKVFNTKSGFNPPIIYHAMGEDSVTCSEDAQDWLTEGKLPTVKLLHSNCVLSFDVEKPYRIVQQFYGKAAVEPQKELCCPIKYDGNEVGHIPQEVIERFYGCGSPIAQAQVQPGETVLDLGSGAGIDCFIAAKKVGPEGKVIGIDMTNEMLAVAQTYKTTVAQNIGFDIVEFKKGFLENIPVENKSVDLVTSNCVINLSPDKKKVFAEIWRILKDNGRLVVADIVADQPVPLNLQAHKDLWGECVSGSLPEDEFISELEKAGFYGLSVLKKTFWKEVEGYKFYSVTIRGFKFEKKMGCSFLGQKAIYLGPYKAVIDEEGHLFPRNELVEICTDTAVKLKNAPYACQFSILEPGGAVAESATQSQEASCCPTGSNGQGCC